MFEYIYNFVSILFFVCLDNNKRIAFLKSFHIFLLYLNFWILFSFMSWAFSFWGILNISPIIIWLFNSWRGRLSCSFSLSFALSRWFLLRFGLFLYSFSFYFGFFFLSSIRLVIFSFLFFTTLFWLWLLFFFFLFRFFLLIFGFFLFLSWSFVLFLLFLLWFFRFLLFDFSFCLYFFL